MAKSSVIFDVRPKKADTDMEALELRVRAIQKDGLTWQVSQLVPLAFGIQKLQITCLVEDDKVSVDALETDICSIKEFVASASIILFVKAS